MGEKACHLTAKTLTLHWHENASPIYTIDAQRGSDRLVTGGGDNNVRVWRVKRGDDGDFGFIEYLSSITKHTQAINCVRFNPTGQLLATASDDGTIMIWERSESIVKEFGQEEDEDLKESWTMKIACFSNNMSEIYDICWSPDSKYICCGLMDNIIRIFSVKTGSMIKQIAEHNHYVQGVTWDPLGEYICSQSADRSVHVYKINKTENGEFSVGPTAYFKSIKSDGSILKASQLLQDQVNMPSQSRLTTENLTKNNDSLKEGLQQIAFSSAQTQSTAATIGHSSVSNTMASTPVLGPIPMQISVSNSTTTMDPPHQTPRHKRTYSNSSTTSTHSIFNRGTSPLPAVMPSSPSLKHNEINIPHLTPLTKPKQHYLYHGETLQSFFRRLTFSPDGALLLATSGMFKTHLNDGSEKLSNTVYVYTRGGINKPPIVHIPGLKKPAIAIRFSPFKYSLMKKDSNVSDVFNLPYRMIFAIATQDSILIYDTQRLKCLGIATNLHYAIITDICWAMDGMSVFASSSDGFISNVVLTEELLGEKIGEFNNNSSAVVKEDKPVVTVKSTPEGLDSRKGGNEKRNILDMLGSNIEVSKRQHL